MRNRLALCVVALAAGCPPANPPNPPNPTPSPSAAPTPGTPGGAPSPSPSPGDFYMEKVDNGDDPLNPGCHYEYTDSACSQAGESFYMGDFCADSTHLVEFTLTKCHPPRCRKTHDCKKAFGTNCVTDANFCGDGLDSAHCEVTEAPAFEACP